MKKVSPVSKNKDATELAICYSCGSEKAWPLDICENCEALPITEEQILISLCSSTYITDPAELEKAKLSISRGNRVKVSAGAKEFLMELLKEVGLDIDEMKADQANKL